MKVLVCDNVHESLIYGLKRKGYDIDLVPQLSQLDFANIIQNYTGIIVNTRNPIDKYLIQKAALLKWVARLGSGKEILDIQELERKNIKIITTPEANCNAVAEHALGMVLTLFRNISRANFEVKNFIWKREENRGIELSNKKVGIIGFGHTGRRLAELLLPFDCTIKVYEKFNKPIIDNNSIELVRNLDNLKDCDVISFHVSYLPENKHLLNHEFISMMSKPFYLINTSRGLVINTKDLIEGLKQKKILGACLDVFENERVNTYSDFEKKLYQELFIYENVILTPHIAGWTHESKQAIAESILMQLNDNQ